MPNIYGLFGNGGGQSPTDQADAQVNTTAQAKAANAISTPAPAQQSPGVFGTGQYYAPGYSGFNAAGIAGDPENGSSSDYGLNNVWSNLSNVVNGMTPQNYSQTAPTASAAFGSAATGQAAQGQAATGSASQYQAALAQAAQARAAQAQGASMSAATAGPAAMAQAPGISTAGDASQLAVQQNLENTLQTQANGGGTSAADLQLQQGEQQNVANQLAVLGSQRGGAMNAGLAQYSAANQAAQAGANLNAQMGVQRAQETLNAQNALGTVADQARGQSQAYNTAQAGLTQQSTLANQGAANTMQQFNVSNEQAANSANAQLAQGNSQYNATNAQATALQNAQLAQQTALANQGAANTSGQFNAGNTQAMTLANMGALNAQTAQNVGNAQQMGLTNVGNAQAMNLANLGNQQATNLANLSEEGQYGLANQQAQITSTNQYYQNMMAAMGAQTGISEADRSAQLASQQLGVQQALGQDQINAQAYQAAANANANLTGATFGGVGGAVSSLLSSTKGSGTSSSGLPPPSTSQPAPGSPGADTGGAPDNTSTGSGNAQTGDQSYSDNPSDESYQTELTRFSDENIKSGIEGGNPMMRSFLDQLGQSKADQGIDPDADLGFKLSNYTKQTSSSGPSDGGIGAKIGSAAGSLAGAAAGTAGGAAAATAAGAAAGSVVPGIGTAVGAIIGLLGGILGGAAGGAADGSGSTSTRNVLSSPGTGETATTGSPITDLDDQSAVATSDDEAKENVISGNRGMQAFLQQASAQQGAQTNGGASNNSFMQTGQTPNTTADRPMPSTPPFMGGSLAQRMGAQASQPSLPPFAQASAPSAGNGSAEGGPWERMGAYAEGMQGYGQQQNTGGLFGGGQGSAGGYSGGGSTMGGSYGGSLAQRMSQYGGGVQGQGGVSYGGGLENMGGVYQGGGTSGTPAVPGININDAPPAAAPSAAPTQQGLFALNGVQPNPLLQAINGVQAAPPPTYPVSQSLPAVGPYLPNGQMGNTTPAASAGIPIGNSPLARMSALSDERSKSGITGDDDGMQDFLDALHAHQYRYKQPSLPGAGHGTFVSPMAQEIEKTDIGKSFVFTDPATGYKKVDYGKAAGTMLAGEAYLNERVNRLEELLRSTNGRAA